MRCVLNYNYVPDQPEPVEEDWSQEQEDNAIEMLVNQALSEEFEREEN